MEHGIGLPAPDPGFVLRVADLPKARTVPVSVVPDAQSCSALAEVLGLTGLKKFRLEGTLTPVGRHDWRLEATLGATVTQPCIITLAPVSTRLDEAVTRTFLAEPPLPSEGETEMPEDAGIEPLAETIDLWQIAAEALALALPPYPRAEGAEMGTFQVTEPGLSPMTDDDARPFAELAALRQKLKKNGA